MTRTFWISGVVSLLAYVVLSLLAVASKYPLPAGTELWVCSIPLSLSGVSLIAACRKESSGEALIGRGPLFVAASLPVMAIFGLSAVGVVQAVIKLARCE